MRDLTFYRRLVHVSDEVAQTLKATLKKDAEINLGAPTKEQMKGLEELKNKMANPVICLNRELPRR